FPFFQDKKTRAFTEDEAVASRVEGAAGTGRRLVVGRKRAQQTKSGQTDRVEHRIIAAGEHEIGEATPHHFERGAQGLAARSTGSVHGRGVTANPKMSSQQRQSSVCLTAAESDRIGRELAVEQTISVELVAGTTESVNGLQV